MEARESLRDVENLRFRFQMNNRLRLECLAAVSKVFREFGEPLKDELLSAMVFALPQELISGNGHSFAQVDLSGANLAADSPQRAEKPGLPPEKPEYDRPGRPLPPEEPSRPALPPESPADAPALPPEQPVASTPEGYLV